MIQFEVGTMGLDERKIKNFHFQELDWLVSFPESGNEGRKYLFYSVSFNDRKSGETASQICLMDVLEVDLFEKNYPHTVGFFRGKIDKKADFCSNYLEIRIIRCIEDFWKFLNDLNI